MNSANMYPLAILGASAALTAFVVGRLIRKAPELGLVDIPNERSSHARVIPRGGGIGVVLTIGFGLVILKFLGLADLSWMAMGAVLGSFGAIAAVSLRDDFRSVRPAVRLGVHVSAAAAVLFAFGEILDVSVAGRTFLGNWGLPIALLWIVGLTNAYNFMDGSDGIAGVQGVVAGGAWFVFGVVNHFEMAALVGLLVAGACTGFLRHNWEPARIFMGDVGSASLGFIIAIMPLLVISRNPAADASAAAVADAPLFAVLTVWPFVADTSLTFIKRLFRKEAVWKPHRTHYYQQLIQCGWRHSTVALYYGAWAIVSAAAGLTGSNKIGVSVAILTTLGHLVLTYSVQKRPGSGGDNSFIYAK